ncbi:MAG TPA: hypothetical protein VFY85_05485 [Gemmatimonadaceae bacterium]|jgi:hypothetical protein|nr:hypothetical protein [Gemmatimonadaceae bacterium]
MTTMLSPERLAVPPPRLADRQAMHLMDADQRVGWIDGDRVGFRGFATDEEAAHAAWVAYRTMTRRLARSHDLRPLPIGSEPLALQRDGHDELIVASSGPVARLVRPVDDSPSGGDSYGFELSVPQPADEVLVRAMAHLIYRTLRKSGVRWTGRAAR